MVHHEHDVTEFNRGRFDHVLSTVPTRFVRHQASST